MNKQPLISIIITNYNYAKYISEAIESALNQSYSNVELIIINDGSTDDSMKIISQYQENPTVRIIDRKNKGVIYTRNQGLREAGGDFVCFLDADDILQSDYIEKMFNTALKSGADVIYGDMSIIDSNSKKSGQKYIFPEFSIDELKNHNYINMTSLIRGKATVGHAFDGDLDKRGFTHEDWDFFLGLALSGKKIVKADDTFLYYRIHENSRNGGVKEIDQHAKYVKSAMFIYDKYKALYPNEFQSTKVDPLRHWLKGIINDRDNFRRAIEMKDREIQEKQHIVDERDVLQKEVSNLVHSKSYRLGRMMTAPYRFLNRVKKLG